jgi:hypothetical protein
MQAGTIKSRKQKKRTKSYKHCAKSNAIRMQPSPVFFLFGERKSKINRSRAACYQSVPISVLTEAVPASSTT